MTAAAGRALPGAGASPAQPRPGAGTSTAQPLIRVEGLIKDYALGDTVVHALAGVSLTIDAGDFVAGMGPSGSGKSTFMNMIGCLDRPNDGRYWLAGEDVAGMDADALASCSSSSTCCRAPARWKTSSCR